MLDTSSALQCHNSVIRTGSLPSESQPLSVIVGEAIDRPVPPPLTSKVLFIFLSSVCLWCDPVWNSEGGQSVR